MNIWHDINSNRINADNFICVIEISKGSKKKYELDKETGLIMLDRILHSAVHYPANYGFIPKTYGDDKDPLDVLLLCSETIEPLTLVEAYPIGVMYMVDNGENDEKIIAIAKNDPIYNSYKDMNELPNHIFEEIKQFFITYKNLENKKTCVEKFSNSEDAKKIIQTCIKNYNDKFNK